MIEKTPRTARIEIRCSEDVKAKIQSHCDARSMDLSQFALLAMTDLVVVQKKRDTFNIWMQDEEQRNPFICEGEAP